MPELSHRWNASIARGTILIGLSFGLVLSLLSVFQKMMIGADPFAIKGFIIPILFGVLSGGLVGYFLSKSRHLNLALARQVAELEAMIQRVNRLEKLLPICVKCKRIRKEDGDPEQQGDWEYLEEYISHRTESTFTHGICPECRNEMYSED